MQSLRRIGELLRDGSKDLQNHITLVDEAHALINPEHQRGRGQFGFAVSLGPQAYHIIRRSLLSIFFLDPEHGFRERKNTTVAEIQKWSNELGAADPIVISLASHQFRCGGSAEHASWLEGLLRGDKTAGLRALPKAWRRAEGEARPGKVKDVPPTAYGKLVSSRLAPGLRSFHFKSFDGPEG